MELHCDEHVRHTELDRAAVEDDTRRALERLAGLGVARAAGARRGACTRRGREEVAAEHDLELCGWDVDTHDWRGDSAEAMLAAVGPELREGAVVLLHDGLGPGALRQGLRGDGALHAADRGRGGGRMTPPPSRPAARAGGGRRRRGRPRPRARLPGRRLGRPRAGRRARRRAPISQEWALVRAVAQADGSVGRIVDGH